MQSSVSLTATTTKRRGLSESSAKKKHFCSVCTRGFNTTGHLARHTGVHTGERNHKCPFPGCETKCSRQDNLQQHHRIHLSPGSRRKSGRSDRSVLRCKNTPALSPPAASPSAAVSTDGMYHREDSPPIEPPALEDSRLYYLARGVAVESPPNTSPLVEAYTTTTPMHHRELPQISTAVSVSAPYWQSHQGGDFSPVSGTYSSSSSAVSASAYQSPVVPQSQYTQSAATSPTLSHASSTSYSSLASAGVYPAYIQQQQRMIHAPQPHITVSASGPYTHPLHSPAAVPLSRTLATRHSIANIAAHTHLHQKQQQQTYATLDPDSPSPPPSLHQSPRTPSHDEHAPAYVAGHYAAHPATYAAQPGMGNVDIAASEAYAAYDAHGNLLVPAHAQRQVQYTLLEMDPVPAMQYYHCDTAPHEVHGRMQKPWSPQPLLTNFPSLRRASHGHPHVYGHGGSGSESYPAVRRDSYRQYVHAQMPQQDRYLAYAAPALVDVEAEEEERDREASQPGVHNPYIYQLQPQPRFHPHHFAGYGWYSAAGEPALVQ